jgi:glycine hydroxymethyltransferase
MGRILHASQPYHYSGRKGEALRAKVNFEVLEEAKLEIRDLAESAGIDYEPTQHGYPHFYYLDCPKESQGFRAITVRGPRAEEFLYWATTNDVHALRLGDAQPTRVPCGKENLEASLTREAPGVLRLVVPSASASLALAWLRDLSDGFVGFGDDTYRRLPGPGVVEDQGPAKPPLKAGAAAIDPSRPYFLGEIPENLARPALPAFLWKEPGETPLRRTPLFEAHKSLGAKMVPFAGWEMPVWYTSVLEEHRATRQAAGLFDVSHMGVWDACGPTAGVFLDAVCANEIGALEVGQSLYGQYLGPDGDVLDDTMIYRLEAERYLIVVNASNDDKDWTWINAVARGEVLIDRARPWATAPGRLQVRLRNLRDPSAGRDMRVDLALQGPKSRQVLLALGADAETERRVLNLKRTEVCAAVLGGFDLIAARTGYTGETMAFELFVHPDQAVALWDRLIQAGAPLGLRPVGLGARDSLRTEAGLPLYGHEMAGPLDLSVAQSGFGSYVKIHKPWFIGRQACLLQMKSSAGEVARFRFNHKSVRMAHPGDPVLDERGRVIGAVTSCAVDAEGFLPGQAYLESQYTQADTPIAVFQSASEKAQKPAHDLQPGDRVTLPEPATVLPRFPARK